MSFFRKLNYPNNHCSVTQPVKYQFYAIILDLAGNQLPVGSSANVAGTFKTSLQKVTGITLNPSGSLTKNIGENFTITATVTPADANDKTLNWSSTNPSVATVSNSGTVSCIAAGTTTISATAADGSGVSASLMLTVRNPLNSLTLDKDQTTILKDGYTAKVTATTDPADYNASYITWTIADTSIATVTISGKEATIKSTSKLGTTTLTVSAGGITKTVKVTVTNFVTTTYTYTGSVQQVDLPAGTYKLEVWGAQGGSLNTSARGGYGGYSQGIISLPSSTTVYICVGGQGTNDETDRKIGGYNGGGGAGLPSGSYRYNNSTGGGATHIGLKSGLLTTFSDDYSANLLLVGGGGGGGTYRAQNQVGGDGGGYLGNDGVNNYRSNLAATGGSQTGPGVSKGLTDAGGPRLQPGFGFGGDGTEPQYTTISSWNRTGCGGGSGFYGGGGASPENASGAGGSGYINTSKLTNAFMYGYNVSTSSATSTKTYSTTNVSSTPTSNYAKSGDGAARITPVN